MTCRHVWLSIVPASEIILQTAVMGVARRSGVCWLGAGGEHGMRGVREHDRQQPSLREQRDKPTEGPEPPSAANSRSGQPWIQLDQTTIYDPCEQVCPTTVDWSGRTEPC